MVCYLVREPDAEPHVRFDERRLETGAQTRTEAPALPANSNSPHQRLPRQSSTPQFAAYIARWYDGRGWVVPAVIVKRMLFGELVAAGTFFPDGFSGSIFRSRQDAKNAEGMGRMTEDEIGRLVVDVAVYAD